MMCHVCQKSMEENFNFKAKCIDEEDFIAPFAQKKEAINLHEIRKLKGYSEVENTDKDVCRLCLQYTEDAMTFDIIKEQFQVFFPEIVSTILIQILTLTFN